MSTTKAGDFTSRKAQFLNMSEDNLVYRAVTFKNRKKYSRKNKSWKKDLY